jgi:protein MpaA
MNSFDPAAYVREIEKEAQAGNWTLRYLTPCPSSTRPWLQRAAKSGSGAPKFYLSAGIHGDEIAGPLAALAMLRLPDFFSDFNTTLFPILNPEGLALGIRENLDKIDLNRDYRNTRSEEIRSHLEALSTLGRFEAALFLHEDWEGIGAYLYELNDGPVKGLGQRMIAAMSEHVPIDERPEIEEVVARGGIIQRADIISKMGPIEDRPEWPEAIYLSLYHTQVAYTTETPMPFPLEKRVQAQIAATQTLLGALREK